MRPTSLLALLCGAQFLVILDLSVVNVALPSIGADLSIARGDLDWVVTAYALVFGSLLLLGGRAADILGRRAVFSAGLGVFIAGSVVSGVADGEAALLAGRGIQGLGAAMLSPAALSILTTTFVTPAERAKAIGAWSAVGGAGAAVGVLLGGVIVEVAGWPWIFWFNVAVGALVLLAARRIPSMPGHRGRLDLPGAALASAGLGALVLAVSGADDYGWGSGRTLGLAAVAAALLALFIRIESGAKSPLVRVAVLRERSVAGGALGMLAASAALLGLFVTVSVYLQSTRGMSALETGLAFLPVAVAITAGAHAGGAMVRARGVRAVLAGGTGVGIIGAVLLAFALDGDMGVAGVLPGFMVGGFGLGLAIVASSLSALSAVDAHEGGLASGLTTTAHEVGGALGVALLVTVLGGGFAGAPLTAAGIVAVAGLAGAALLPPADVFRERMHAMPAGAAH